jgi:hypothetical protein
LSFAEPDAVSAGEVNIVTDTGYVGIEIKVGGYGVAVWATGGSICGSVITPQNPRRDAWTLHPVIQTF